MQKSLQLKLIQNPKMKSYLAQNSDWYKYLNRDVNNYKIFEQTMKEKYKVRVTDKLTSAMDNIDLISNVLNIIK